ncbi:MAG: hypothetical protein AAF696_29980 [Bacteroidota bacterium]
MKILCFSILAFLTIANLLQGKEQSRSNEKEELISEKSKRSAGFFMPNPQPPSPSAEKIIENVKGRYLDEVYYALANYPEPREHKGFHDVDVAVLIKCTQGQWLNWLWREDGRYGIPEYILSEGDIQEKLEDEVIQLVKVSNLPAWRPLLDKRIQDLKVKYFEGPQGEKILADLILQFDQKSVSICSTDEPAPSLLPELSSLDFATDWSLVIFEENLLTKHGRNLS